MAGEQGIRIDHNGKRYRWIEDAQCEPERDLYCVARLGADGFLIPGTRLSGDYDSPSAVIALRDEMRKQVPDAEVFGSRIVDRLTALP